MSFVPAHKDAVQDAALRGAPLAVYDWLLYQLDRHCFTEIKISGTASALHMKRRTVRVALRLLRDRGYLDWRPTSTRALAYRILDNRRIKQPQSAA